MAKKMTKRGEVKRYAEREGITVRGGKSGPLLSKLLKDGSGYWVECFDDWEAAHTFLRIEENLHSNYGTPYPWNK